MEECTQRCSRATAQATVEVTPTEKNIYPGSRLEILCSIKNAPTTQQVPLIWRKLNSATLPRGVQLDGGRLTIESVNAEHAGEWECRSGEIRIPGSLDAYTSSAITTLRLIQGPLLRVRSSVDKVVRYGNIEFTCELEGASQPSKIEWSKIGQPILPYGSFDNGQGVLVITGVDRHHEGIYQCHAKEAGLRSTVELRLADSARPAIQYFIHVDKKAVSITAGQSAEVVCRADSPADAPAPDRMVWKFEGSNTLPSGVRDDGRGVLKITNRAGADASGTYSCNPSSGSGTAKTTVVIREGNTGLITCEMWMLNCNALSK